MIKYATRLFIATFIIALTFGCDDECSNSSPPPTAPIRFAIVDKSGNNLVTDATSRFHPDSIKLYEQDHKTNTIFQKDFNESLKGFWFQADCYKNEGGSSTLFLHFDNADIDTLLVSYETIRDKCYTFHQYTHFLYNGKEILPSGETRTLRIVK
ncbi:hypothetical protein LZD49_34985 [Dyadobacter sp. CY261]|uniref:hypothetical protein n=1 Tax=Dyadobacter sp. CY261 TaxID=2907203 RepID=UPI001F16D239|nr:hypothetical protein [Dyadobacter sp. CY261]MCF0075729.1 hypothetical protein [Dyadobacter sp. CY261]